MKANDVSKLLAKQADIVCSHLLPKGKVNGYEYEVGNLEGDSGKSLKIHLKGEKAGVWKDYADEVSGDLIGLWMKVKNIGLYDAVSEAKKFLGLTETSISAHTQKKYNKCIIKCDAVNKDSPVFEYLMKERLLTGSTINKFKVKSLRRNIVFPYIINKKPISAKYLSIDREENKKVVWREKDTQPCLFGWDTISTTSRSVIICEGEIDAMTVNQYGHNALSVPLGAGGGDKQGWIEYDYDRLSIFDEIYLCFDNDDAGKKGLECVADRLGRHRCKVIKLPHKDPNKALQKGMTKEEFDTFINFAEVLDPPELKKASDFLEDVIESFYPKNEEATGLRMPFAKVRHRIAFRPAELSVWCGINGHGKSQFLGHIICNYLTAGAKVFVASMELKNSIFLRRLYKQLSGRSVPTRKYITKISESIGDNLYIYNKTQTASVDNLLKVFEYAHKRYYVKTFFIDSMMKCDVCEEDYRGQKIFIDKLCDFKNKYDSHIHLVTHPRKASDERGMPNKFDIKGTGAITDLADNCFTIWRNKKKQEKIYELEENGEMVGRDLLEQHDALIGCWKQRNGDWEGKFGLYFDNMSCQYLDKGQQPTIYIEE